MKISLKDKIKDELEQIRGEDPDHLLKAEAIVAFALEHKGSALYSRFPWDDKVAAHQQRLAIARGIVRSYVATITPERPEKFRAYVSIGRDRKHEKGGYRASGDVFGDSEMRAELVAEAYAAMKSFMARYDGIQELAGVFKAMEVALSVGASA